MAQDNTVDEYQLMLDDDLKLAQMPGTENELKSMLSPIASQIDTVTAIFFVPSYSPRCEVGIMEFQNICLQNFPNEKLVLVACYPNVTAAAQYIHSQKILKGDIIFSNEKKFLKVFSTNLGSMHGAFVARIDLKNGRMITGGQLSYVSKEFMQKFVSIKKPLPFHIYNTIKTELNESLEKYAAEIKSKQPKLRYEPIAMTVPDTLLPTSIRPNPMICGDNLLFSDNMLNIAFLYGKQKTGGYRLTGELRVPMAQRDSFITVTKNQYESLKPQFRYMVLSPCFVDGGKEVCVPYSIPKVFEMEKNNFAFYNQAVYLRWNISPMAYEGMTAIEDDYDYMNMHYEIYPLDGQHIAMMCNKYVWPRVDETGKGDPTKDPYMDGFYNSGINIATVMNLNTGKITKRIGQLGECQRQTKTGIWFVNFTSSTCGDQFAYSDGYSGKVLVTDKATPERTKRTYEAFAMNQPLPRIDSTKFFTMDYYQDFTEYFCRCILQLSLGEKDICCLVALAEPMSEKIETDKYCLVRIDRKSGRIREQYVIDKRDENETVMAYGLTQGRKHNIPFYISFDEGGNYRVTMVDSKR